MKLPLIITSLASAVLAESHVGKRADHAGVAHKHRATNETALAADAGDARSLAKRGDFFGPPNLNPRFTYYAVGLGACGDWNIASDYIVAMNSGKFQQNGGYSQYPPCICGMQISINYNGQQATATVKDECPTCPNLGDLDLSQGLFEHFADTGAGELWGGSWEVLYDPCNPNGNPQPAPSPTSQYTPPQTTDSSSSSSSTSTSSSSEDGNRSTSPQPEPTLVPQNLAGLGQVVGHLGRVIWQAAGMQGEP